MFVVFFFVRGVPIKDLIPLDRKHSQVRLEFSYILKMLTPVEDNEGNGSSSSLSIPGSTVSWVKSG